MICFLLFSCWISSVLSTKPNIVFFLTDDQDIALGGFAPMERTRLLLAEQGANFVNAFATNPTCCPSRSSILTGLYPHNHRTVANFEDGGCYSDQWKLQFEDKTYAVSLKKEGYRTFFAGKYLNTYGYREVETAGQTPTGEPIPIPVPLGWDWWIGLVGNDYYNYFISVNGTSTYRGEREEDYLTDVLRDYSLEFLNQGSITEDPFLMVISTTAAHMPFTPANRHFGMYENAQAPRTPNFNVPVNDTKPYLLRRPPRVLSQFAIDNVDMVHRRRLETLLAVDELVDDVVTRLDSLGVLDNTYLVFSSDHGYHFGQFAMAIDKRLPYEFDIRMPLVVRGPGIPPGTTVLDPVANIDFAPTFLDMAGAHGEIKMDGESFLKKTKNSSNKGFSRTIIIEHQGEGDLSASDCTVVADESLFGCNLSYDCKCTDVINNTYTCIRHLSTAVNEIYCAYQDDDAFKEFYDIYNDPDQLTNLALDPQFQSQVSVYDGVLQCCFDSINRGKDVNECFHEIEKSHSLKWKGTSGGAFFKRS